jgi:hypothetical protein
VLFAATEAAILSVAEAAALSTAVVMVLFSVTAVALVTLLAAAVAALVAIALAVLLFRVAEAVGEVEDIATAVLVNEIFQNTITAHMRPVIASAANVKIFPFDLLLSIFC